LKLKATAPSGSVAFSIFESVELLREQNKNLRPLGTIKKIVGTRHKLAWC
jgi:hypothetical protein